MTDQAGWFGKLKPELQAKNGLANLPYLLDGDKVVCESDAILVYLALKAGRSEMIGKTD